MRKRSMEKVVWELLDMHPNMTPYKISKKYGIATSCVYRHKKTWEENKSKQQLTVPNHYKASDIRLGVVGGFVLGIIFTITAASVAGVL
jgi:hypothetical protein